MSSDLDKMPTVKLLKQTVDAESEMMRLFDVVTNLTKQRAELVEFLEEEVTFHANKTLVRSPEASHAMDAIVRTLERTLRFIAKQGGE